MTETDINKDFKPLVIKDVIKAKNPRLANMIPGFIYRYLKKPLALDDVNEVLRLHGHRKGFEFASASIDMFNVSVEVKGLENLPEGGPFIFVSNHPLGGFDGVLLMREIGERYNRNYRVLVNDILMNVKNMDDVFVPINKHGGQAAENVKMIDELFRSDTHIMTFPAGLVSRKKKGVIRDTEWKKSFISKAVQHHRDVVPIHITGSCSNFFYRLANFRKRLGIKINIEMFYLPRETFKHRNNKYTISIGKPISYKVFDKKYRPVEWAQKVKDHCYSLAEDPHCKFNI